MRKFKFFDKEGYLITLSSSKVASCERTATDYKMICEIGAKLEEIFLSPRVFASLRRLGLFKGLYYTKSTNRHTCYINLKFVDPFSVEETGRINFKGEELQGPELNLDQFELIREKIIDELNNSND